MGRGRLIRSPTVLRGKGEEVPVLRGRDLVPLLGRVNAHMAAATNEGKAECSGSQRGFLGPGAANMHIQPAHPLEHNMQVILAHATLGL